ncbi:Alpha/Beta hydrolase protein [Gautieria morchelliformis]|nr:Alpha/Beta hydrolase protein [Gautieria morchelliformis]
MSLLVVTPYVFKDVNPDIPDLKLTAKRYTLSEGVTKSTSEPTFTLFLTHGNGNHKEHWEPTIERLFSLQGTGTCPHIVEAWSFDWQNHGDGAVINQDVLERRKPGISLRIWAQALVSCLQTDLISKRRLVAVGHSAGSTALLLSIMAMAETRKPFELLIVIEPHLIPRKVYEHAMREGSAMAKRVVALRRGILSRRDTWPTKEYALQWLSTRMPWKLWDKNILQIYVEHGLRIVHSSTKLGSTIVTLKCSKLQEEANYTQDSESGDTFKVYEHLHTICATLPVHVVFGERDDVMPRFTQDLLVRSHRMASVTRIPNAGHQVLEEAPAATADVIARILKKHDASLPKL